ncbi:MAG: TIGR03084 family metal-binding protein [Acidimicrobiaceae bacterium]|nr:TIGR03084 family metal-binding protein [Acidimicrobiaceae bacterium]
MNLADLLEDLLDEQASLDKIVAPLSGPDWDLPTPSPRWSVTDQIGHLRYFDRAAALAIRDPEAFSTEAGRLMEASLVSETSGDDFTLGEFRGLAPAERLERWRWGRAELAQAASTLGERDRVTWYGPSMGAKSFVTARLMEAWAHGTDVCDAVGAHREPTHRLRHIAQLGYITRAWTYINRGEPAPAGDVRVKLTAPSGDTWTWGDAAAAGDNSVTGPALDFCLVVTQRRHVADTALEVTGEHANDWLYKAQAFAGPPTDGPSPARERREQAQTARSRS